MSVGPDLSRSIIIRGPGVFDVVDFRDMEFRFFMVLGSVGILAGFIVRDLFFPDPFGFTLLRSLHAVIDWEGAMRANYEDAVRNGSLMTYETFARMGNSALEMGWLHVHGGLLLSLGLAFSSILFALVVPRHAPVRFDTVEEVVWTVHRGRVAAAPLERVYPGPYRSPVMRRYQRLDEFDVGFGPVLINLRTEKNKALPMMIGAFPPTRNDQNVHLARQLEKLTIGEEFEPEPPGGFRPADPLRWICRNLALFRGPNLDDPMRKATALAIRDAMRTPPVIDSEAYKAAAAEAYRTGKTRFRID
ncbi:hypothetical protein [Jannaschia aquimarina]|uniref:Uncharacterized protein n=1 Tax=Jannaschia aquimarina TaxID=935700 RepID=A0A0D1CQ57_9RHOB|nr:hypothetical protein [Jannaschia aquimarina]KIT16877.1 hypothetical protein jaqu_13750 [Jannaschia aquimarina]SNT12524.1 hypothetical protein SAMN05421775_10673 [Jannaschia aquimarina]